MNLPLLCARRPRRGGRRRDANPGGGLTGYEQAAQRYHVKIGGLGMKMIGFTFYENPDPPHHVKRTWAAAYPLHMPRNRRGSQESAKVSAPRPKYAAQSEYTPLAGVRVQNYPLILQTSHAQKRGNSVTAHQMLVSRLPKTFLITHDPQLI
jgi:hypothetical protein